MDASFKLSCLLDAYRVRLDHVKRQALIDSESGDFQAAQFNNGQVFVLQEVIQDFVRLQSLLEVQV